MHARERSRERACFTPGSERDENAGAVREIDNAGTVKLRGLPMELMKKWGFGIKVGNGPHYSMYPPVNSQDQDGMFEQQNRHVACCLPLPLVHQRAIMSSKGKRTRQYIFINSASQGLQRLRDYPLPFWLALFVEVTQENCQDVEKRVGKRFNKRCIRKCKT
ncbi:uncharacterized protein G2W53_029070 [Senna tora]|uniref:Uncharacterized protein n=1 Tax=Senna tora TaxID=362788 RepID=A0A834T6H9_9FABA|nr:uncharacterized protein G2W53_029070 [Senna tora]